MNKKIRNIFGILLFSIGFSQISGKRKQKLPALDSGHGAFCRLRNAGSCRQLRRTE